MFSFLRHPSPLFITVTLIRCHCFPPTSMTANDATPTYFRMCHQSCRPLPHPPRRLAPFSFMMPPLPQQLPSPSVDKDYGSVEHRWSPASGKLERRRKYQFLELELAFLFATPPALVAWCIVIWQIIPTTIICTPSHPHPGKNPDQRSRRRLGGVRTALGLWGRQQTVTEEGLPQYYPHSFFLEEPRLCVFHFPFLFVQKKQSKNKFVQSCCQESLLYEIGNGSHFISLRNQDGSNYPFADDVKNHICLVSPAQSKKIPKWLIRQS